MNKSNAGFSYIEICLALLIWVGSVTSMIQLFYSNQTQLRLNFQADFANKLAFEKIQNIHSLLYLELSQSVVTLSELRSLDFNQQENYRYNNFDYALTFSVQEINDVATNINLAEQMSYTVTVKWQSLVGEEYTTSMSGNLVLLPPSI